MKEERVVQMICVVFVFCATTAITLPAQILTTLHSFTGPDGNEPYAGLVQASDGNLYGTTPARGANNYGTVFKITPSGTLTALYSFCPQTGCADGSDPQAGLVQGSDGNFYETTSEGGSSGCSGGTGCGTVFKITLSGAMSTNREAFMTSVPPENGCC